MQTLVLSENAERIQGDDYIDAFRQMVREVFADQAGSDGRIDLIFFRLYLLARKLQN